MARASLRCCSKPMHRAELILQTLTTLLTGLSTTGTRVTRARTTPVQAVPAIAIYMGTDTRLSNLSLDQIDSALMVHIDAYAKQNSGVDSVLNAIREEVNIAIQADPTLGDIVVDTIEQDTQEPELSHDSDQPTAVQRLDYLVHYRRTRTDPSTGP